MSSGLDERKQAIETGINIESRSVKQSALDALTANESASHARDDALSPRQFEQLVKATYEIKNSRIALESRAVLFLAGRVGLRKGEITHLTREWFDWGDGTITIPRHQPCVKGQYADEPCGYCRRRAEDRVTTNNITLEEANKVLTQVSDGDIGRRELTKKSEELVDDVNMGMEDALEKQWQPKTPQSARTIPFDFDVRVKLTLEKFTDMANGWENSAATVNRRVNRVQELSAINTRVYPHALRATAASYHASRDVSIHSLMSIMGWADPSTARAYVTSNDDQAAREIRSKHR